VTGYTGVYTGNVIDFFFRNAFESNYSIFLPAMQRRTGARLFHLHLKEKGLIKNAAPEQSFEKLFFEQSV